MWLQESDISYDKKQNVFLQRLPYLYNIRKKGHELVRYVIRDGKQINFKEHIRYPDTALHHYRKYIYCLTYGGLVSPKLASDPSP